MGKTNDQEINVIAETDFRGQKRRFGIKTDDRRRHMYIIGKTGMGKSVLQENMIYNDIIAGKGVCVVDPHGDLVENALKFIPSNRINDVVYFNPADLDYPIAFNVIEKVDPAYRHLVASGLVSIFHKLWADSWGPRLEYLLRNAILALLEYPDSTLLGVTRILVDKEYRKKVLAKVKDPVVRSFWVDEYSKYTEKFQQEAIAPIQNKVGQFLSTSLVRNIVGQVKSTIDIRKIMDEKKILLVNLSKGRIGEDASQLLGAMMITKIQLAAMGRVDIPEKERSDFYLFVDEFQNFATQSFANILSEARKYRLNLIIAHQFIAQLIDEVRDAVFGNVGTFICFRVGAADAEEFEKEFAPRFTAEDLVNIPKYHIYLKLMIDGVSSDAFSAKTIPPLSVPAHNEDKIIAVSRERYARDKDAVEEKISRWAGLEPAEREVFAPESPEQAEKEEEIVEQSYVKQFGPKKGIDFIKLMREAEEEKSDNKVKEEAKQKAATIERRTSERADFQERTRKKYGSKPDSRYDQKREQQINTVKCASCGKDTKTKFTPDGRPIYCPDCFKKAKMAKEMQFGGIKILKEEPKREEILMPKRQEKEIDRPKREDQKKQTISLPAKKEIPKIKDKTPVIQKNAPQIRKEEKKPETPKKAAIKTEENKQRIKPGQIIKF